MDIPTSRKKPKRQQYTHSVEGFIDHIPFRTAVKGLNRAISMAKRLKGDVHGLHTGKCEFTYKEENNES